LVGDPDAAEIGGIGARGLERGPRRGNHGARDLVRIVLDPSRPRIMLADFAIGASANPSTGINRQNGGAGGTLIDCQDQVAHRKIRTPR
jgi:hypothetical protein